MKSVAGGQGFGHLRICGCSVDPASAPSCLSILIPVPTKTTTKPKGLVAVFVAGSTVDEVRNYFLSNSVENTFLESSKIPLKSYRWIDIQ